MHKKYQLINTDSNSVFSRQKGLLGRISQLVNLVFLLSFCVIFSGFLTSPVSAMADTNIYNSTSDLYIEVNVYGDSIFPPDVEPPATDPVDTTDPTTPNADNSNTANPTATVKSPNTASGNNSGQYITKITYDIISRSVSDKWLVISVIALATISLCVLTVWLIRRHLKKTGLSPKYGNLTNQTNISSDPNTEVIDINKLLKKHKAKRIFLQITPVLTFALVGLSASWAVIQSYAATLPSNSVTAECTPASNINSCIGFGNGTASNPLQINVAKKNLTGDGTITIDSQANILLKNIANATGSMEFQANLAETPNNKITSIEFGNSDNLIVSEEPNTHIYRTNAGVNAQQVNLNLSLTIDKSIAEGVYPIKIKTTLTPDTLQTFDKTNPIYASITPVDGQSTVIEQDNATLTLPDARDFKLYRIRKFTTHPNNQSAPDTQIAWWWMIDNLAFDLTNPHAPAYSPAIDRIVGGYPNALVLHRAQYVTTGDALTADMGYLYNYCAATADTSPECIASASIGSEIDSNEDMPNSICPAGNKAPWRLPKGNTNPNLNEFAWLNGLMAGKTTFDLDGAGEEKGETFYSGNWAPTGVWQGSLSGIYTVFNESSPVLPDPHEYGDLFFQGLFGFYISSTATADIDSDFIDNEVFHLYFKYGYASDIYGGTYEDIYAGVGIPVNTKYAIYAVRCVL